MSFAFEMMVVVFEPFMAAMHFDRKDDDFLDNLNHKISSCLMFFFVIMHTFYQLFRDKVIHCWTPAQFPDSWVEYTNAYCWSKNTYYVPPQQINLPVGDEVKKHIIYYQWVPFILAYLGILTYLPGLVWYVGSSTTGLSVEGLAQGVRQLKVSTKPDELDKYIRGIGYHLDSALRLAKYTATDDSECSRLSQKVSREFKGKSLTFVWTLTKLLYVLSSALQIYSLYKFMGSEYLFYGIRRVWDVFQYEDSPAENTMFPKVTICDFEMRTFAEHRPYTVQCNLSINIFNSKIFLFLWYWYLMLAVLNVIVFIYHLSTFTAKHRVSYIKEALLSLDQYNADKERMALHRFVHQYLDFDGYITMKYMAYNTNDLVSASVVKQLWMIFKQSHHKAGLPNIPSNRSSPSTPTRKRNYKQHTEHPAIP